MASPRTRTALYSAEARQNLADAVIKAREHAGWPTTVDFSKAVDRAARALYALENAEPTVGQVILHAVGRTLGTRIPGWTQDTPRRILEGHPPPPLEPALSPPPTPAEEARLTDEDRVQLELLKDMIGADGIKDEVRYQLMKHLMELGGVEMTPDTARTWVDERDRLRAAEDSANTQATQGEHS